MSSELRSAIFFSIARALWGEVYPEMRSVAYVVLAENAFRIDFYVDGELSDELIESACVVETEVIADFPSTFEITHRVIRLDAPDKVPRDGAQLIYARKEPTATTDHVAKLIERIEGILSGDRSIESAQAIEILLADQFPEDELLQDAALMLASYRPEGGVMLYGPDDLRLVLSRVLERLRHKH